LIKTITPPSSPFGPFVNHNHFAGFVEMIAPIPVALILRRAVRGELAFLYGFASAMMGLAVIMSLSPGAIISLVPGFMFVAVFGFKPAAREGFGARRSPLKWIIAPSRVGAMIVMVFAIGAGVWWVGADPVIRRMEKSELAIDAPGKEPGKETFLQSR